MSYITKYIDKQKLKTSFIFTYFLGFLAHGFSFLNLQVSHDCLSEFTLSYSWKIRLGRYFKPIYDIFFGKYISLPWINGLITLFWLSLCAYLIVEIFNIQKRRYIAIVCGILCTNITVTTFNASFLHDVCADMFGIFITILSTYLWKLLFDANGNKQKVLLFIGISFLLCLSLGIYQSFITIYISLVIIISILKLTDIKKTISWKIVWKYDFIGAFACLCGGTLYYAGLKLILAVTGFQLIDGNYNSLTNLTSNTEPFTNRLAITFAQFFDRFFSARGYVYSDFVPRITFIMLGMLVLASIVTIVIQLIKKNTPWQNIVSAFLFLLLLPFAMNLLRMLNPTVHELMIYAYWFIYVLFLLIICRYLEIKPNKIIENITIILMCCFIWINIQTANALYAKKNMDQQATNSVMTRVVERIELLDGYIPGVTPVTFVGTPSTYLLESNDYSEVDTLFGAGNSSITYQEVFPNYMSLILKVNMNIIKNNYAYEQNYISEDDVEKMPVFPAKDGIQMINDTVVVKFQ